MSTGKHLSVAAPRPGQVHTEVRPENEPDTPMHHFHRSALNFTLATLLLDPGISPLLTAWSSGRVAWQAARIRQPPGMQCGNV